ncbi:helix-turn-helix domain-containing protein [Paractinoplanes globisporus]|uniref:Helix-turn-helix domain-containing protein n=1 Tax=Paractinoplanes globisporus TaxID=113565 RepID=A0ABW6W7D3_9ACTN|nr:helix-turn-helix domain-containing protein [Actinoplanes globisporus]
MDVVSTDGVPAEERFAYWREVNAKLDLPYDLRCEPRAQSGFGASVGFSAFGPVQTALATMAPHSTHRTTRLIRQADPGMLEVGCTVRGRGTVTQDGRRAEVCSGDLVLLDTSRPYEVEHAPEAAVSRVLLLRFARSQLPLPPKELRHLTAVRIPGDRGLGTLPSLVLLQLARQLPELSPSDTSRLSTLVVDVLTTALGHALETRSAVPPHSRQRTLKTQVYAFIQHNLGDERLTPEAIAAAHHISLRYLHKLFQQEGHTVAGYIRGRRLEQCRHDIADPGLAASPIHELAARWGFPSSAHFSRVFRGAYGLSPAQFRRQSAP